MAGENTNKPKGLVPWRWNQTKDCHLYQVTSGASTAIFIGDPVTHAAAGTVAITTPGSAITGVVVGCFKQELPNASQPLRLTPEQYVPASDSTYYHFVLVCEGRDVIYLVQEDSVTSNLVLTDRAINLNLVAGTGNTTTGLSGWMLDSNTGNTTATLDVKLLDIAPVWDIDKGAWNQVGQYCKWLVKINNYILGDSHVGLTT